MSNLKESNLKEFVIRPNATFNTRSGPWMFGLLALICLSIAIRFAILGYWLILPFALFDIVAVGLILYLLMRRHAYVEKIRFDNDDLVVRHVQKNNRCSWRFPLHWVRVNLQSPEHRWYSYRLLIGSKGQWVEVGQCLTDSEKKSLAKALELQIVHKTQTVMA